MTSSERPFVGIIGGFWELKDKPSIFDEAKKTAREIGAEMAAAGMGLVVYFSNDESLEPHVVSGYVKALPSGEGKGSIRVRYAQTQKTTVSFAEQITHKDVFEPNLFPSDDWEAPFYRSLAAADGVDAVLLMAGARSTRIAGQIAVARPLPVLAVDKFDGAAGVIREELAILSKDYPSAHTHTVAQMVAWLKKKCEAQADQRAQARARESLLRERISQKDKVYWAAGAFFALLATLFFALGTPPDVGLYAVLTMAGLIAAGATGALIGL